MDVLNCDELTELSKPVCHKWVIGMLTEIAQILRCEYNLIRIFTDFTLQ